MATRKGTYAVGTTVSVEKSQMEIKALLRKHGAPQQVILDDDVRGVSLIGFTLADRQFRIVVPLPRKEDFRPSRAEEPRGWYMWGEEKRLAWMQKAHEQATRERWRVFVLLLKAKLEAIALGLSSAEKEFFADLVLPSGSLYEHLSGQIAQMYLTGKVPTLMLSGGPA